MPDPSEHQTNSPAGDDDAPATQPAEEAARTEEDAYAVSSSEELAGVFPRTRVFWVSYEDPEEEPPAADPEPDPIARAVRGALQDAVVNLAAEGRISPGVAQQVAATRFTSTRSTPTRSEPPRSATEPSSPAAPTSPQSRSSGERIRVPRDIFRSDHSSEDSRPGERR